MSYTCPLNFVQVDAYASRIRSLIVSLLVITYLVTNVEYILYFLVLDFMLKLFVKNNYSVISVISLSIRKSFKIKEKFTDGGAKRLAAIFGLIFVFSLVITHIFELHTLSLVVAGIFLSCSLLDVLLNYCIGCQIYYTIKKIYPSFME